MIVVSDFAVILAERRATQIATRFHRVHRESLLTGAPQFAPNDMPLVTRKGVYPYEYTDCWDRLSETSLPERSEFFSTLTEEHVAVADPPSNPRH